MIRLALLAFFAASSIAVAAEEWPQFRGPGGEGHAEGSNIPAAWSEAENIAWKTPLAGRGWSSPVVSDGVAWVTSAIETPISAEEKERIKKEKLASNPIAGQMEIVGPVKLFVMSVDAKTGKPLKRIDLFDVAEPAPIHSLNSYASPSPIIDKGVLYVHFGTFGTAAIDAKTGDVLWKKQLAIDHSVGPGSSPVLYKNLLIIPCDGTDKQFVAALDVKTGEEVWRTERPPLTGNVGDLHKAFATPLVVRHKERDQVIVPGAQWFVSYEPMTGKEIWRIKHGEGFSNVPRPVVRDGIAYLCTGFMTPELLAVKIDGKGDVTETHSLWRHKRQVPSMSSPLLVGGELYFVGDQGVLTCLDAKAGEQLWQKRLKGNYSASPLYVDGKIFFCNREGETTVIRPGREWNEVGVSTLSGQLMASPAVLDQALLVRSDSHLYRIEHGKAKN